MAFTELSVIPFHCYVPNMEMLLFHDFADRNGFVQIVLNTEEQLCSGMCIQFVLQELTGIEMLHHAQIGIHAGSKTLDASFIGQTCRQMVNCPHQAVEAALYPSAR